MGQPKTVLGVFGCELCGSEKIELHILDAMSLFAVCYSCKHKWIEAVDGYPVWN